MPDKRLIAGYDSVESGLHPSWGKFQGRLDATVNGRRLIERKSTEEASPPGISGIPRGIRRGIRNLVYKRTGWVFKQWRSACNPSVCHPNLRLPSYKARCR